VVDAENTGSRDEFESFLVPVTSEKLTDKQANAVCIWLV